MKNYFKSIKMKTFLAILLMIGVVAAFFYMAGTKIQLKPFKITFDSLLWAVGYWLIFVGIILVCTDAKRDGYKKGYKKAFEDATEIIEQQTKEIKLKYNEHI